MSISITEASKQWNIPRVRIYEKINKGELSRLSDKRLDPAEMSRVFGSPRTDKQKNVHTKTNVSERLQNTLYQHSLDLLENQLKEAKERAERAEARENRLLVQLDKLTDTLKLLEAPRAEKTEPKAHEPTYTPPPQPVRDYSQWEEDHPRKKKGLLSRFF